MTDAIRQFSKNADDDDEVMVSCIYNCVCLELICLIYRTAHEHELVHGMLYSQHTSLVSIPPKHQRTGLVVVFY